MAGVLLWGIEFEQEFPAEGQYVERKTGVSSTAIQETVVAFSNADGGVVLIGVEDGGHIVGRQLTASVEDALHETLASSEGANGEGRTT